MTRFAPRSHAIFWAINPTGPHPNTATLSPPFRFAQSIALQPVGSLTPGYRKDVYCSDELLNDSRYPKSAMKANCDNFEQPDTYVYPANLRLTQPGAIQDVLNKYINDIFDGKQDATPAIMKQMTTEVQQLLDQPML